MQQFKADLRDLDNLMIAEQAVPTSGVPKRRVGTSEEKRLLRSALTLGKLVNSPLGLPLEILEISDKAPTVTIKPPSKVPMGMSGTPGAGTVSALTIAVGIQGSAYAVNGISLEGGLYASTTGEWGFYGSAGGGLWTNVGACAGPVFTVIFGPPSDLAGVAYGIGADLTVFPPLVGVSGLLIFSPPPFKFLGFAAGWSVGPSLAPCDVNVQISGTGLAPMRKPKIKI
jgi:hypothetical protein